MGLILAACSNEITYPLQCGAALSEWALPGDSTGHISIANRITLQNDGSLLWNGFPVPQTTIAKYTHEITTMDPRPFTILKIEDGASCAQVRMIRNLINQQAKCQEIPAGYYPVCGEGEGFVPILETVPKVRPPSTP